MLTSLKIFFLGKQMVGQQQVQRNLGIESTNPSKPELRRSKRDGKKTSLDDDFYTFLVDDDPRSYKEAMTSSDASLWKEVVKSEIESIMDNHTWEIVALPHTAKTIDCK